MSCVEIETNVSFCWYVFHDGFIIPRGLRETPRGLEIEITLHSRTIQFSDRQLDHSLCAVSLVNLALHYTTKHVSSRLLVLELLQYQGIRAINFWTANILLPWKVLLSVVAPSSPLVGFPFF
jgi:hypothetical protein